MDSCRGLCGMCGLLNIVMNDMEEGMNNAVTKVADDAKLFIGLRTRAKAECEDWQKDETE